MILRPVTRPAVKPVIRSVIDGGSGRSLEQQISALFASGEQGAWYDPSDLSTLFQDAAGTTPVTALGQPVGLMLDKSKGLVRGPELVTDGGFDDPTKWTAIVSFGSPWSISGSKATLQTGSRGWLNQTSITFVVGRWYEASYEVSGYTGGSIALAGEGFSAGAPASNRNGRFSCVVQCTQNTGLRFWGNLSVGTEPLSLDNVSVRELPGHHASQLTATARPTLQQDANGKYYLQFDGVDDKLTTTFPNLGTNVTIARSLPGTGASILTGQTIGAGAWNDSTDSHALVIVNRGLILAETTNLTRWLNRRAGA